MLAWNNTLESNRAWRVGNCQGGAMDITTHVVAASCERAVGGRHARRRSFLRQAALFALFAGALGLEAPAHAQHPVTLWITGVAGFGAFPPDWYPLLGSTPAEACVKFVGFGMEAEARAYEQRVQTYGAEWVCPAIFELVSPAPACVYRAYPSYTKQSPGQACTTSAVESTLANLPFRFAAGESKGAGQSEFGSCQRANPVNLGNGNKLQSELDYRGAGALPLELVRTYNSRGVLPDGRIGRGWRHGVEIRTFPTGWSASSMQATSRAAGATAQPELKTAWKCTTETAGCPRSKIRRAARSRFNTLHMLSTASC